MSLSSLSSIIKKAYRKRAISKKEYEELSKNISDLRSDLNKSIKNKDEIVLGSIKLVKDRGITRLVFDNGSDIFPINFNSDMVIFPQAALGELSGVRSTLPFFEMRGAVPLRTGYPVNTGESDNVDYYIEDEINPLKKELEMLKKQINERTSINNEDEINPLKKELEMLKKQINERTSINNQDTRNKETKNGKETDFSLNSDKPDTGKKAEENTPSVNIEEKNNDAPKNENNLNENYLGDSARFNSLKIDEDINREHKEEKNKITQEEKKLGFIDIKSQIPPEKKKDKKEDKKTEKTEKKKKSLFKHFFKIKKREDRNSKLERLVKENLEKTKLIEDNRRSIIKVAYILKDFLEIRSGVPYSTTYSELISIIKNRKDIDEDIKKEIYVFFNRVSECEYSRGFEGENFENYYKSARKIVEELSE